MRGFILLALLLQMTYGKIYKKCELAAELKFKFNFSMEEVKNWVCIAEYESTFNTESVNRFNWDGSKDFGLFQLNNRYWCGNDHGSNVCNIPCEALLDEDLTDDIACANRIVKDTKRWMKTEDGLVAWVAYVKQCQYKNLDEYIQECSTELSVAPLTPEENKTPSPTDMVPEEVPQVEPQPMEGSTSPPRASGFEGPRVPPTKVSEESTSESESTPPRASGIGSSGMGDQNMKPETSVSDMMTTKMPEMTPAPENVEAMEESMPVEQTPSRASGMGSSSSPVASSDDMGNNVISLENLPIRAPSMDELSGMSKTKPIINDVSGQNNEEEEKEEEEEDDRKVLSSSAFQQAMENLENLQHDLIRVNLDHQNYEPSSDLKEFYAPDFSEYLPNEPIEIADRYAYEPISESDLSVIQFLQQHGAIPMFESRLPTYVNPNYRESGSPYSSLSEVYEPMSEYDSDNIDPFGVSYDRSQYQYNPEFTPKKAFSFINPFSGANIKNIFKPFPIFNFNSDKTVETVKAAPATQSSGFNFVKPFVVPQFELKPINFNVKKLITPLKISIPYPKLNVVKETVTTPPVEQISISKPHFKPFEINLKRIIKPIPVPTFVKKPVELPHLQFKPMNFSFLKPSIDKTSFWNKDGTQKERTLFENIY